MIVAARAMAERKTLGHRSWRVAMRRQSLSLLNMISMRLRRLYRRLSWRMGLARDFRGGCRHLSPWLSAPPGTSRRHGHGRRCATRRPAGSPAGPPRRCSRLTWPAVMKKQSLASVTACSLMFSPPFRRPIERPRGPPLWMARPSRRPLCRVTDCNLAKLPRQLATPCCGQGPGQGTRTEDAHHARRPRESRP